MEIPDGIETKINKIIYNFIWNGPEKIKISVLINDITNGGLNMLDIKTQFISIKAAWIPRFFRDIKVNSPWTLLAKTYFNRICSDYNVLKMNFVNFNMLSDNFKIPKFYQEIIVSFLQSKNIEEPKSKEELLNSVIWGNKFFTYKDKSKQLILNHTNWQDSGVIQVKDIKFENGKIDQSFLFNKIKNKRNKGYIRPNICLSGNHLEEEPSRNLI